MPTAPGFCRWSTAGRPGATGNRTPDAGKGLRPATSRRYGLEDLYFSGLSTSRPTTSPLARKRMLHRFAGSSAAHPGSTGFCTEQQWKNLFTQRCAVSHGADIKGTGPWTRKSNPPTPDLTSAAFRKRLQEYPGVIVSSVILRPNGDLIPRTLRENGVKLAPHPWTVQDFRDLNRYMSDVISKSR